MAAKVHLHLTLRQFTNGEEIVELDGKTVGECLKSLVKKYPAMESSIFGKNGKLSNIVETKIGCWLAFLRSKVRP